MHSSNVNVINLLKSKEPKFHQLQGKPHSWAIRYDVLEWLDVNVKQGMNTLETGAGYSTVVFMSKGANHIAISPAATEHNEIKKFSSENNIPTNKVSFYAQPSQNVLPNLDIQPLDLVLIDGAHAFPFPYIDWYFIGIHVKKGGLIMIDDTQLSTVDILKQFLLSEKGRWKLVDEVGKTAVFEKTSEEMFFPGADWGPQPFTTVIVHAPTSSNTMINKIKQIPVLGALLTKAYRFIK